jgi:hypothetical protein
MASTAHFYIDWAKERMDEMDAILASLEGKTTQAATDSRLAADKMIADLRAKRDTFFSEMKKQSEAGEAAWLQAKAKLESEWNGFQADVKKYVERFGQQLKQQQSTFENAAAAQVKAWRQSAEKLQAFSADVTANRRGQIDTAVQQMREQASAAEARFQKLAKAGSESWTALSGALAESRATFDRANQAAWEALKRASAG